MGAATGCCQEDAVLGGANRHAVDFDLDCERARASRICREASTSQVASETQGSGDNCKCRNGRHTPCCKAMCEVSEGLQGSMQALESLSYLPVRFEDVPTADNDRSQARYSKIVVHSMRARTQKRTKAWEEWLRRAVNGQEVIYLREIPGAKGKCEPEDTFQRIAATYQLDRGLTKLSMVMQDEEIPPVAMTIENIQVICSSSDFTLLFSQIDKVLTDVELSRAVVIQYLDSNTERKLVCFLMPSDGAREEFVQAMTALWLEKRNDHSMWF